MKKKINNKYYFQVPLSIILLLLGLIGPGFWQIKSPTFNVNKNFLDTRSSIDFNDLNIEEIELDKKFLNSKVSTRDLFNKEIAIAWSSHIYDNARKQIDIPKMFFSQLPSDLKSYETKKRKKLFISIMLPLLIRGNDIVIYERKKLKTIFKNSNFKILKRFCVKYKVLIEKCLIKNTYNEKNIDELKDELFTKINTLPLSMMLAQAAIESGWGLSRFAQRGNALFGQWTWNEKEGIKPKNNISAKFAVRSFENLQESVNSYILNLNTHRAYKKMRKYRKLMMMKNKLFEGKKFAKYLDRYAEIGYDYVLKVIKMIESNKFEDFDNLKLKMKS